MQLRALTKFCLAIMLFGCVWIETAGAVVSTTCADVSGFNTNSTAGTKTAIMKLEPGACTSVPPVLPPGDPNTLASTVTGDVPVLGTSTGTGPVSLRWTTGGAISNVMLNDSPVPVNTDVVLTAGANSSSTATNTITFEHATLGDHEFTVLVLGGGRRIGGSTGIGNTFNIVAPDPTITSISPNNSGLGGADVTIVGTHFTAATSVTFGGTAVVGSFVVVNSTTITATAPPASTAGSVSVIVTNPAGTNPANSLYTYNALVPTVTSISPTSGPPAGGTLLTIKGSNFTGATQVDIGSNVIASPTVVDDETITVTTPANIAAIVDVKVTTPGGASDTSGTQDDFSYRDAPTVTGITPSSGPIAGSTMVTIVGDDFTDASKVQFNGVDVLSFTVDNDGQISAVTPPGTAGSASVEVTTNIGTNAANTLFTYVVSTVDTPRLIATFMQNRALNLLNAQPDITRFIDGTLLGGGSLGGLQINGNTNGYTLNFTSSLGRLWQTQQAADLENQGTSETNTTNTYALTNADVATAALASLQPNAIESALTPAQRRGYDFWMQVHGVETNTQGANSSLWVGYVGGHTFISPNLLVGAVAQIDWAEQSGPDANARVEGFGWMVGPYMAARVPDQNLFFDMRAAWGKSNNDISPDGTYTDSFDTERWLINAKLSGAYQANGWVIRPAVEVSYFEETQQQYVDSLMTIIDSQSISVGELRFGPSISRDIVLDNGIMLRPKVGVAGVWNFAVENATNSAAVLGTNEVRARIEAGMTALRQDLWSLDLYGFYDGIGVEDFESFGGSVRVTVPLP